MKQTLFNVENLFNDNQKEVRKQLMILSESLPLLGSEDDKKGPINVIDKSLSSLDEMDIMIIFRGLIDKGYLPNNLTAYNKLEMILSALKYQNLNITKFGLIRDTKSANGKFDLILVLPDDRDIVFSNNVKNIEYILANKVKTDDQIIKESEFNVLNYPRICLFEYGSILNTLTHVDTKTDLEEPIDPEFGVDHPCHGDFDTHSNDNYPQETIIPESKLESMTFTNNKESDNFISGIRDKITVMFSKETTV